MGLFSVNGLAQDNKSIEIGALGGISYYNGDINPGKPFVQPQPVYGIIGRYNFTDRWAVKVSLSHGNITGNDKFSKAVLNRNLSFKTDINEIAVTGEFNFMKYNTGSTMYIFSPYLLGGFSTFQYTPRSLTGTNLRNIGTEGQIIGYRNRKQYKNYSFALIFGFGFKYSLTKKLGFAVEWGMRKTFTDYLDDISTTYYQNKVKGLSDPTGKHLKGEQRGNSKTKDWYNFTTASITYKIDLNKGQNCKKLKW